eukprot:gene2011-biopygen4294
MVLSLGIAPSGWIPCSRQYSSQGDSDVARLWRARFPCRGSWQRPQKDRRAGKAYVPCRLEEANRLPVRASVRPRARHVLNTQRFGRTDGRTHGRTDDMPLAARACRAHKPFLLVDPSVALASQEIHTALHGRGASVRRVTQHALPT